MEYLKQHKKLCIIVLLIILVIGGIVGYNMYQEHVKKEEIKTYTTQIKKEYTTFENEKDRSKKVEDLKTLTSESEKYSQKEKHYKEVTKLYSDNISNMKKYFTNEYNKTIKDNTLENVDKIDDKDKLNKASDNLTSLLKTIKAEVKTISTEDEVKKYEKDITSLTGSYSKRLKAIEEAEKKAEEERKAREAAAAKARAQEQARASSSSKGSTSSNSSSSQSSSSSSNKGSSGNSQESSSGNDQGEYIFKWDNGDESHQKGDQYWDNHGNHWTFDDVNDW